MRVREICRRLARVMREVGQEERVRDVVYEGDFVTLENVSLGIFGSLGCPTRLRKYILTRDGWIYKNVAGQKDGFPLLVRITRKVNLSDPGFWRFLDSVLGIVVWKIAIYETDEAGVFAFEVG